MAEKKATTKKKTTKPKTKTVLFVRQPAALKLGYAEGNEYELPVKQADALIDDGFCIEPTK